MPTCRPERFSSTDLSVVDNTCPILERRSDIEAYDQYEVTYTARTNGARRPPEGKNICRMVVDRWRRERQYDSTDRIASRYVSNEILLSLTYFRLVHVRRNGNRAGPN